MRMITLSDGTRCTVTRYTAAAPFVARGPADVTVLVASDAWSTPRVMALDATWENWPASVVGLAVAGRLAVGAWSAPESTG
jgi:hypothetical protein